MHDNEHVQKHQRKKACVLEVQKHPAKAPTQAQTLKQFNTRSKTAKKKPRYGQHKNLISPLKTP